jgi:GNAT superfamily N-acetyltransferase
VSVRFTGTERFDPASHDVSSFSCGNELLDRWLVRHAGQNERRDAARTFVGSREGLVYSYYTLVAGQLEHAEATPETKNGLPDHFPIPVAILARLAVDTRHQGQGIGALLLNDALHRVVRASEHVAVRAVVVHAIDNNAASFYENFGFRPLSETPQTLMTTLAMVRAAGYETQRSEPY